MFCDLTGVLNCSLFKHSNISMIRYFLIFVVENFYNQNDKIGTFMDLLQHKGKNTKLERQTQETPYCQDPGLFCCVFAPHVFPVTQFSLHVDCLI